MSNLVIKNGCIFNKEGVKQPLEIGNIEQINLLKEYNKKIDLLKNEGVELGIDYEIEITASAVFKCVCGTFLHFEESVDDENDISSFHKKTKKCHTCGNNYKLQVPINENILLIKLI